MIWLMAVTLIWGFSFGLIKNNLASVDSFFVSLCRMGLSLLVFLPFLRLRKIPKMLALKFMLTGAVQFGIMYIFYIYSFHFLKAYEVALFTIFTPLYVTILDGLLEKKFLPLFLATALMSIAGTAIVVFKDITTSNLWIGFLLVQVSNLAFAAGQVVYRRVMRTDPEVKDPEVFALLYAGGVIATGIGAAIFTKWNALSLGSVQIWSLVYLGIIASGVGFFLWNLGSRQVNIGALAVANDLKVPVAIAISLLVFGEKTDIWRLLMGGILVTAALLLNELFVRHIYFPTNTNS
jgi:drug/metabolite transporter (DMT)-like permease